MRRYAQFIIQHRLWIIAVALLVTSVLAAFAAGLKIIIDPATMAPQDHPYMKSVRAVEQAFGSKYLVMIGITPKRGDVFQAAVLQRLERITSKLEMAPGVVHSSIVSLTARQAKAIRSTTEGFEARPLLDSSLLTQSDKAAAEAVLKTNPIYMNTVVSPDFRTAAILVELEGHSDGFQKMLTPIRRIMDAEAGPEVSISASGTPVYMAKTEEFAERINFLFPLALLVIGLLHFEAFRTVQGLILPLVTALMAVIWGVGFIGLLGQQLDIFNSPTPILILAIAAGHAVQLLKRYYEEYEQLRTSSSMSVTDASHEAVIRSLEGVGLVMLIAGTVAALGFFSLVVFKIPTIRTFGIFTGIGILSAVLLEMTFIPAVRSLLLPPSEADRTLEAKVKIWDRIPQWIADWIIPPSTRRWVMLGLVAFTVVCIAGMMQIEINSDSKSFFSRSLDIQRDDQFLNRQLGGANALYIMIEGEQADAVKSPALLRAIEATQRFAEAQPFVGKTVSIVDFLKRMNGAMHSDEPAQERLPQSRELVSQYLLLYSLSGEPSDFDAYVDYNYRVAKIAVLLKTSGSLDAQPLISKLQAYTAKVFEPGIKIRFGGDVAETIAVSDTMIQGKILNIVQIALAIFVVSALAFRSMIAGLIVLMPLTMAVLAVFGAMGALNIPLNVPNSLITAMAVGIGADYAIYLLYRMREQVRQGASADAAVRKTLATAGKATLYVGTAVAGGYGVLALSIGYNVHLWLSLFIVLAMIVSAFASLILVPSLVLYLKPGFVFDDLLKSTVPHIASVLLVASLVTYFCGALSSPTELLSRLA